jgi:hypothetical protein
MAESSKTPDHLVFVDDDGDEFPLWRIPGESQAMMQARAQEVVDAGGWVPNGALRLKPSTPGA